MTACALNGQAGICCNQDCKVGGNCCNDNDCSGYNPTTHTKMVCECPSGSPTCSLTGSSYSCKPKPTCADTKIDCDDKWCCDKEVGGTGNCVSQGTIYSSKYLCDPPGWSGETSTKIQSNNLISIVLNFFANLFS
jgi:hypothetical protein